MGGVRPRDLPRLGGADMAAMGCRPTGAGVRTASVRSAPLRSAPLRSTAELRLVVRSWSEGRAGLAWGVRRVTLAPG